jgi:hypothetical protein
VQWVPTYHRLCFVTKVRRGATEPGGRSVSLWAERGPHVGLSAPRRAQEAGYEISYEESPHLWQKFTEGRCRDQLGHYKLAEREFLLTVMCLFAWLLASCVGREGGGGAEVFRWSSVLPPPPPRPPPPLATCILVTPHRLCAVGRGSLYSRAWVDVGGEAWCNMSDTCACNTCCCTARRAPR